MFFLLPNLDYGLGALTAGFTSSFELGAFAKFSDGLVMVLRGTVDCAVDCFAWEDNSW